jgi:hypothetical protein
MPRIFVTLAVAAFAVGGLLAASAGHAQIDWQTELADEILIMEDCEVSFLTQVIERTIDGREVILAKVHCADGRTYDASRDDSFAAFSFSICEPEDEPAAC